MLELGWFSTGRGEGSRNLLRLVQEQIAGGSLPARIQFVFCNREQGEAEGSDQFAALVHSYGIPLVALSSQRFRRERNARSFNHVREEFDQAVLNRLADFSPNVVVLAGYMLFTAAEMCQRFNMINLHPAKPGGPVGTWQQVIWELIGQRAEEAGAQVQYATMDWDQGPVISYCTFPITGPEFDPLWEELGNRSVDELKAAHWEDLPLFQRIRAEGVEREGPLVLETIRAIADGSVNMAKVEARAFAALRLNGEIESQLRTG
jgi:phosphoribosylglycinamide formyltransferase-1